MKVILLKDDASIFNYIGVWLLCGLVAYLLSIPVEFMFSSPRSTAADYWMNSIVSIAVGGMSTIAIYSFSETLNKRKVIPWIVIANLIASVLVYLFLYKIDITHAVLTIISLQIFSLFFYFTFHKDNERFDNLDPFLQSQVVRAELPTPVDISTNFSDSKNDKWAEAYSEYESDKRDWGLYARLYSHFEGDESKTKAAYLKERVAQLQDLSSLNSKDKRLQALIVEANIFSVKDGFVIGIKNPLVFLYFKNEKIIFSAHSIEELESKASSFQDRTLLSKEQRELFLERNLQMIISEAKHIGV